MKPTAIALLPLFFAAAVTAAEPAADKSAPQTVGRFISGVYLQLSPYWTRVQGMRIDAYKSADNGELWLRYPGDFKSKPESAKALQAAELQLLKDDPKWQQRGKQVVNIAPQPAPAGYQLLQTTFSLTREGRPWLEYHFYLTTPEQQVMAIDCTAPGSATAPANACTDILRTVTYRSLEERNAYRDKLQQEQRAAMEATLNKPCSAVNQGLAEYRAAGPDKPVKQFSDFETGAGNIATGMLSAKEGSAFASDRLTRFREIYERMEQGCRNRPQAPFNSVLQDVLKFVLHGDQ